MARKKIDYSDTYFKGKVDLSVPPIDRLEPESEHHDWVLEQLNRRIRASEAEMSKFYDRWRVQEKKFQAYMSLPDYEQILKDMNDEGKPPAPAIISFPYTYAVISTIVTYLVRNFCSRKPIFQLGISSNGTADRVRLMETVLQYQADYNKLISKLFQHFKDGELYGVTVMRNLWVDKVAYRTTWQKPDAARAAVTGNSNLTPIRSRRRVYAGADVINVDPFMFFPDPNVPMTECSRDGEFMFYRDFKLKHQMAQYEDSGDFKWTEYAEPFQGGRDAQWYGLSSRNLLAKGNSHAGNQSRSKSGGGEVFMIDQGTVRLIPAEWGLGEEETPQLFLFTIANRSQIIQCEALDFNHDDHPFTVAEPYTQGYAFGSFSQADMLGPIQDFMSWLIDSHIFNIRTALNNMWIVDPARVEIQDIKNPQAGKIIRLKPTAFGQDVKTAIQQLPVQDVTRGHIADLQTFMRIGDTISAVSDNLRGVQREGGRKTATEVRTSIEGGASRLAAHAMIYSSQSIVELCRQMTLNTQQYMDQEIYLRVLGEDGSKRIGPTDLMGDFIFPAHDGTMPLDRMAAVDIWKEILMGMMQDQELRAAYSVPKVFEHVAELGGAVNISSFRLVQNPDAMGNMVPFNDVPPIQGRAGGSPPLLSRAPQRAMPTKISS